MINDSVFVRAVENTRKHHENLLLTKCQRRNHLVLEPNYYTTKWFSENLLVAETKKAKVFMNKSVYISFFIFDMGKTDVFQFRRNYIKDKCNNKARLC